MRYSSVSEQLRHSCLSVLTACLIARPFIATELAATLDSRAATRQVQPELRQPPTRQEAATPVRAPLVGNDITFSAESPPQPPGNREATGTLIFEVPSQ